VATLLSSQFRLCGGLALVLAFNVHAGAAERSPKLVVSEKQMASLGIQTTPLQTPANGNITRSAYPAQVIAAPDKEQVISSPLTGIVVQLLAQQNQSVKQGAPLIRLSGQELGQQQLELMQAASRFNLARQAMQREQQLFDEGIIPARRIQEAKAAYTESQATLQQAKATLRLSGMSPSAIDRVINSGKPEDSVTLTAPKAGILTRVEVKPGQRVDGSSPLVHMTQLDSLWLEIKVPARDATKWPPGTQIKIQGRDATARILNASPVVAAESQMQELRATVDAGGAQLRPGELVVVELPVATAAQTAGSWELPLPAVAYDVKQAYVFVRTADGFEARPVTVSGGAGQHVQVQGNLKAGEQVAVSGVVALKGAWLEEKGGK
jgi:RND family efflux transporter MFP subunit